jgi:hypothetical protein
MFWGYLLDYSWVRTDKRREIPREELYYQDLRIASICGVFLIIISDIYTTISIFA